MMNESLVGKRVAHDRIGMGTIIKHVTRSYVIVRWDTGTSGGHRLNVLRMIEP